MPPTQDDQPTPDVEAAAEHVHDFNGSTNTRGEDGVCDCGAQEGDVAQAVAPDAADELDHRLAELADAEAANEVAEIPALVHPGALEPEADEQAEPESRPFELSTLEQIGLMQARGAVIGVAQQAQSLNQVVIDEVRETLAAQRRRETLTGGSEEDLDALYTELKIIGAVERFRQVLTDIQEKAAARAAIRTPAGPTPEQLAAAAAVAQPNGGGPQG